MKMSIGYIFSSVIFIIYMYMLVYKYNLNITYILYVDCFVLPFF